MPGLKDYFLWKKNIKAYKGLDVDNDHTYDYLSFYMNRPTEAWGILNDAPDAHFSDRYKAASHPTFSNESVYSGKRNSKYNPKGITGGYWQENPNVFVPSKSKRDVSSLRETADYISYGEPEGLQIRDEQGRFPKIDGVIFGGVLPEVQIKANFHAGGGPIKKPKQPIDNTHPDMSWHEKWLNQRADILGQNIMETETHPIWEVQRFFGLGFPGYESIGKERAAEQVANARKYTEYVTGRNVPDTLFEAARRGYSNADGVSKEDFFQRTGDLGTTYPYWKSIVYPSDWAAELAAVHERTHALSASPQKAKIGKILMEEYPADVRREQFDSYYENPSEIYSRLMDFRQYYGLDPKKKVTKKDLEEWRSKGFGTGFGNVHGSDLLNRYDDDVLLRLFNEVADNGKHNSFVNMAAEGGQIYTPKKWDDMSMAEVADVIKVAVKHGITNLQDIKKRYNEFAEGVQDDNDTQEDGRTYNVGWLPNVTVTAPALPAYQDQFTGQWYGIGPGGRKVNKTVGFNPNGARVYTSPEAFERARLNKAYADDLNHYGDFADKVRTVATATALAPMAGPIVEAATAVAPVFAPGTGFWATPITEQMAYSTVGGSAVDVLSQSLTGRTIGEGVKHNIKVATDWDGPKSTVGNILYDFATEGVNPGYLWSGSVSKTGKTIYDILRSGTQGAHAITGYFDGAERRGAETLMRTTPIANPLPKVEQGVRAMLKGKNGGKIRLAHIGNYILSGKRVGPKGYYNSLAPFYPEDTSLAPSNKLKRFTHPVGEVHAYSGFVDDSPGSIVPVITDRNDMIDAFLYGKEIDPSFGLHKIGQGKEFGPHTDYIRQNYKTKAHNIPVYEFDKTPYSVESMVEEYPWGSSENGLFSSNGVDFLNAAGHLVQLGNTVDGRLVHRLQDIWKFNPNDYTKKWLIANKAFNKASPFIKGMTLLGLKEVDRLGTPVITRTKWTR